jgi:hypothetical protein
MSVSKQISGSVLGANTVATVATASTGSHKWLLATSGITICISATAYIFSLLAKRYR